MIANTLIGNLVTLRNKTFFIEVEIELHAKKRMCTICYYNFNFVSHIVLEIDVCAEKGI